MNVTDEIVGQFLRAFVDDRRSIRAALEAVAPLLIAPYEQALRSIAANTCCDKCREAALVAQHALDRAQELDPK